MVILISVGLVALLTIGIFAFVCRHYRCSLLFGLAVWSRLPAFAPRLLLPIVAGTTVIASIIAVKFAHRRLQVPLALTAGCLVFVALLGNHLRYPRPHHLASVRAELDEAAQWLRRHPADGTNRRQRRERMAVIQKACDRLRPEVFDAYRDGWRSREWLLAHGCDQFRDAIVQSPDELEAENPALYYLRQTTLPAMDDIRQTHVEKGLAVWLIYNMGYVFKTPDACFGIDVVGRDTERLADDLDFLLVTHRHWDHYWEPLKDRMVERGKPVVVHANTAYGKGPAQGCILVSEPREFRFGGVRVKVDLGDHLFPTTRQEEELYRDFVLMYQIDCGESAGKCTVYHTGDADNPGKMKPDRNVDLLIVHSWERQMVRRVNARMTLASHVLELGHSPRLPRPGRVPFSFAYRWTLDGLPEDTGAVLTWGERWLLPGTVLQDQGI